MLQSGQMHTATLCHHVHDIAAGSVVVIDSDLTVSARVILRDDAAAYTLRHIHAQEPGHIPPEPVTPRQ